MSRPQYTEERLAQSLRELYSSFGYTQYKMSKFEEYDLYVRNKSFLLSDSVITFTDTSGKLLALKPDVTLSIVKNEGNAEHGVRKLSYNESVYRVSERTGAFREISQTGLECLGEIDGYHLSEVLFLAQGSLATISDDFVLDVSHMGLLSLAMDAVGVAEGDRAAVLEFLSQKNRHDLLSFLATKGIFEEDATPLTTLLSTSGSPTAVLPALSGVVAGEAWQKALDELFAILSPLDLDRVRVDFSLIHDLSYYNGIVFGGFVAGVPECVLSGGQYDRLMERMGKRARAIGFAVYPDRLDARASLADCDVDTVVLYGDGNAPDAVLALIRKMAASGARVLACRQLPTAISYRDVYDMTKEVSRNG